MKAAVIKKPSVIEIDDFNKAFETQRDPSTGALKVVIIP